MAIIAIGFSSFLWYKHISAQRKSPDSLQVSEKIEPWKLPEVLLEKLPLIYQDFGIDDKDVSLKEGASSVDGINAIIGIKVSRNVSLTLLNLKITGIVRSLGGNVFRGVEEKRGKALKLIVGIGDKPSCIIYIQKVQEIHYKNPQISIIIDNLGPVGTDLVYRLCNIKQTITFSVLPFEKYSTETVITAKKYKVPFILDMPVGYSNDENDKKIGTILASDDNEKVFKKLNDAFKNVSGAKGLKCYTGSTLLSDQRTLEFIMEFLKKNSYFFVDRKTSNNSTGYEVTQSVGVRSAGIDGIIGDEEDYQTIETKLDEYVADARDKGTVIIVCRCSSLMVDVLERKLPSLDSGGIRFVQISDIAK